MYVAIARMPYWSSGEAEGMTAAMAAARQSWTEYVQRITRGVPREVVAEAAGIHVTGVYRWLRGQNKPRAEQVVAFARGIGQPPIEALVHAGYLEPVDAAAVIEVHPSVTQMSDDELIFNLNTIAAEIERRLAARPPRVEVDHITPLISAGNDDEQGIENNT